MLSVTVATISFGDSGECKCTVATVDALDASYCRVHLHRFGTELVGGLFLFYMLFIFPSLYLMCPYVTWTQR